MLFLDNEMINEVYGLNASIYLYYITLRKFDYIYALSFTFMHTHIVT